MTEPHKSPPPMVLVTWEDAATMDSETWVQNVGPHTYEPQIHRQLGFLLSETDAGIVITACWNPDLIGAMDSIPMGMVRSMEYLEPKRARRARKA